jgi:hypothetical protein
VTYQTTNDTPITLDELMRSGWFSVHQLVDRMVSMEHFTDPVQRRFDAPRRIITGRVLAVSQAPDGDILIRFDGMPAYTLAPSDVIRFGYHDAPPAPQMRLGRAW